jgi:mRNA degradation ribonuclease J1/J2
VYTREESELTEGIRSAARAVIARYGAIGPGDINDFKNEIRTSVRRFVSGTIKRSPMVFPIVVEV